MISRRRFLETLAGFATALLARPLFAGPGMGGVDLKSFDEALTGFISKHQIPGASLAVSRLGRLVYARGFGLANVEKKEPVEPDTLFRIASISKSITAVAVLKLAELGKLSLSDSILSLVKVEPFLPSGAKVDSRWKGITILQLLQHTAGFDRDKSMDPGAYPQTVAKTLSIPLPVKPESVIRYMLGRPLDFNPGERYAYSNFGYLLLGRAVEAASGKPYESFVRKTILAPLGIKKTQVGRALLENRAPGESHYYDSKKRMGKSVVPPKIGESVAFPDGAENFDSFDSYGGWISTSVDLVKFMSAFDDPAHSPLLKESWIKTMWARPSGSAGLDSTGKPSATYYGCGWRIRTFSKDGSMNVWHTGMLSGTATLLVRRRDGLNWAVLFNMDKDEHGESFNSLIDPVLHAAANEVKVWPETDGFGKYL